VGSEQRRKSPLEKVRKASISRTDVESKHPIIAAARLKGCSGQKGYLFMRFMKGSLLGLVVASILALAPTVAFARGGGGGGHGGGFGGGHGGGFGHGGGHFAGFAGHSFAGHSFAEHQGAHFARYGDHFRHHGDFFLGSPFGYGDAYSDDYPYFDYNDYGDGGYYDGQYDSAEVAPSEETIVAVQKQLAQLGYYHGPIDGLIGPQTDKAISWFQSVDKLSITGKIDDSTLKALRIS
jgi:Putative peptidoglycan binding domain